MNGEWKVGLFILFYFIWYNIYTKIMEINRKIMQCGHENVASDVIWATFHVALHDLRFIYFFLVLIKTLILWWTNGSKPMNVSLCFWVYQKHNDCSVVCFYEVLFYLVLTKTLILWCAKGESMEWGTYVVVLEFTTIT